MVALIFSNLHLWLNSVRVLPEPAERKQDLLFFITSNPVLGWKWSAVVYVPAEKQLSLLARVSTNLHCVNDQTKHTKELFPVLIIACSVFLGIPRQSKFWGILKREKGELKGSIDINTVPFSMVLGHGLNVLHKEYWLSLPSSWGKHVLRVFHIQVVFCSRSFLSCIYVMRTLSL